MRILGARPSLLAAGGSYRQWSGALELLPVVLNTTKQLPVGCFFPSSTDLASVYRIFPPS